MLRQCLTVSHYFLFQIIVDEVLISDFEGIDACASNTSDPNWPICVTNTNVQQDGWPMGQASNAYAYIAPQYVRQQLGFLWNTYRPKAILVSE